MSNTGLFRIRSLSAEMGPDGTIFELHEVEAECASCARVSDLSQNDGLLNLAGAGVLVCPGCGSRQGVSRARFEEFARRFPSSCAPVSGCLAAIQQAMPLCEKASRPEAQAVKSGP